MKMRVIVVLLVSLLFIFSLSGCKEAAEILTALPSEDILGTWVSTNAIVNEMGTVAAGAHFTVSGTTVSAAYTWTAGDEVEIGPASWTGPVLPNPTTSITSVITITDDPPPTGTAPPVGDTLSLTYIMSGANSTILIIGSDRADCVRYVPDIR